MHDTKVTAVPNNLPANNQVVFPDKNKQQPAEIKTSSIKIHTTRLIEKPVQNASIEISNLNETAVKEQSPEDDVSAAKFIEPVKTNDLKSITGNNINPSKKSDITNVDLKKTGTQTTKQFDPSVINNIPKDNSYNNASVSNNTNLNDAENRPVKRRTNVDNGVNNQNVNHTNTATSAVKNSGLNYVSVPEYISMNDGSGNIQVKNISDVDLDLAVVDVMYYDASGRFRKGETLYLHNLRAGKSVTIKTAKDADAAYATSKVSLVSSDANGVYAVGDN